MTSSLRIVLEAPRVRIPGREHDRGGLDLVVEPGRRTVLLGRSGAGKSLLARIALGRLPLPPVGAEGRAVVEEGTNRHETDLATWPPGSQIPFLRALRGDRISFVPQGGRDNLVPSWTVLDHLKALLPHFERQRAQALQSMEALGVDAGESNLRAVATELSEGMIRRILVALAMARGAEILVIDEPTTGLDPKSRAIFAELLEQNIVTTGAGVLLVTHDLELCRVLQGEALLIDDGAVVARADRLEDADGPFLPFLNAANGAAA